MRMNKSHVALHDNDKHWGGEFWMQIEFMVQINVRGASELLRSARQPAHTGFLKDS